MKSTLLFAAVLTTAVLTPAARSAVVPNVLFSDNAVLQQGREVPVWGTATDGERVTVKIAGQEVATTAQNGRWLVRLKPLPAGGPYTMTISGAGSAWPKAIELPENTAPRFGATK